MDRYPLYIFDLDGTLLRGSEPIPGAVDTVAALRAGGSQIRFVTNNSPRSRAAHADKLAAMGFAARADEVYSSAFAAGQYLRGQVSRACVIGEDGLVSALADADIRVDDVDPEVVVVGLCRTYDYALMTRAMSHLLKPHVRFVATNRDATFPLERGRLVPGAGAIVASLVVCTGREPELVGKPEPFLIESILRDAAVAASDALVVGDRVDTDIVAGQRAGCPVHLVLTGVTEIPPAGIPWSADLLGLLAQTRT
jgi:phosphoglycolate/pyridoxal phosphate phosphatase family enzyme